MAEHWHLSVIIPLHDTADSVVRSVRELARQTAPMKEHEVILVDPTGTGVGNAVVAGTSPSVADAINLRGYAIDPAGRAAAWNFGVRQARGNLILLLGDDFVPERQLIAEHLALHAAEPDSRVVGIGPGVFPAWLRSLPFLRWLEDSGALFGASFTRPDAGVLAQFFYGANTSLKRGLLEETGYFDETFAEYTTDDYELGIRLKGRGARMVYLPKALAYHEHEIEFDERLQAMRQTGKAVALFEAKHPELPAPSQTFGRPAWFYLVRAATARLAHRVSGVESWQARYFQNACWRELARGYREARRAA